MLWIYQYALYYAGQDVETANKLLVDVYRVEGSYDDKFWELLFGKVDKEFCNEINLMLIDRGEELITTYTDPKTNDEIGLLHCVGTFAAYYSKGTEFNNSLYIGDIGGWLGDFVTLMADYTAFGRATGLSTKEYVELYCGSKTNLTNNTYPYDDYVADTDGYNLAKLSNDFGYNFISAFAEYFMLSTMSYNRYNLFFEWRQNNEQAVMRSLIEQTVDTSLTSPIMAGAIIGLYELQLVSYGTVGVWLTDFSKEERAGLVDGYINIQNQFIQSNEK